MSTTQSSVGALNASLNRNSSQVKRERAAIIERSAERVYRRMVEDLEAELEELEAAREAQLDMSPSDINKIVTAAEFKAKEFCEKDADLTMQIREVRVKLDEYRLRLKYLFGEPVQASEQQNSL